MNSSWTAAWLPFADGFAKCVAEYRGVEFRDHFGAAAAVDQMRAGTAHEDHFDETVEQFTRGRVAGFGEAEQDLIPVPRGAKREVVDADGAAVGEREGNIGADDQDARFSRVWPALMDDGFVRYGRRR